MTQDDDYQMTTEEASARVANLDADDLRDEEYLEKLVDAISGEDVSFSYETAATRSTGTVSEYVWDEAVWLIPTLQDMYVENDTYDDLTEEARPVAERLIKPDVLKEFAKPGSVDYEGHSSNYYRTQETVRQTEKERAYEQPPELNEEAYILSSALKGDFLFRHVNKAHIERSYLEADDIFRDCDTVTISNSILNTDEAFRHSKDVTLLDSIISAEELFAYSGDVSINHSFIIAERFADYDAHNGELHVNNSVIIAENPPVSGGIHNSGNVFVGGNVGKGSYDIGENRIWGPNREFWKNKESFLRGILQDQVEDSQ